MFWKLYLMYLICRDNRGFRVDHSTIGRWVLRYALEHNKRISPGNPSTQSILASG